MTPHQRFSFFNETLSPSRVFWLFALTHLLIWTVLPLLCSPNAPLDVIEGYAWGHEWLLGTYKHPPMQAWWLESLAWLTGRAAVAHFLASQLAIVIAFWAVWQTGLRILGPVQAMVGVLLLEGVIYYNFTSPEFNPNVLQIPFWALIGLYYHRSIREDRLGDWLLLGLAVALGLYTKYSTVLLPMVLAVLTLVRPEARRRLARPGPYIALVTALVLFAPHLWWLFQNHFMPFTYAQDRLQQPPTNDIVRSMVKAPLLFAGGQFLAMLPCLLIFLTLSTRVKAERQLFTNFDKAFLLTVTFGPLMAVMLMTAVFGLSVHSIWATPFWNFLGIWLLTYFQPVLTSRVLRRFAASGGIVLAGIIAAYIGGTFFYPYLAGRGLRIDFPGQQLSAAIDQAWTGRFHTPLHYAMGDTWLAGNVAYYSPDRPQVYIGADPEVSTWIDTDRADREGGVILWCIRRCSFGNGLGETPTYVKNYPRVEIQPPLELNRQTGADLPPVVVGWAIVPPR